MLEHGRVAALIASRLIVFTEPRGLGVVTVETGFVLEREPDTMRGPDVSFVRSDRSELLPREGFVPGAPNLAVEIVSPGNSMNHLFARAAEYISAGSELVWIVDSKRETAIVVTPAGTQSVDRDGILDGGTTLPGFTLPLAELFRRGP